MNQDIEILKNNLILFSNLIDENDTEEDIIQLIVDLINNSPFILNNGA